MMTLILFVLVLTVALIVTDRVICAHFDRELADLRQAHDRRSRNRLARFEARWGRMS